MTEKRISFLLNIVVREMNRQADGLLRAKFGITYSQFAFLMRLSENPQIDVTRLADALGVTKGAVSNRLVWFLDRSPVSSQHDPGNSKRLLINLTTEGLMLAKSAGAYLEKTFTSTISKSGKGDFKTLTYELIQIHESLLSHRHAENLA